MHCDNVLLVGRLVRCIENREPENHALESQIKTESPRCGHMDVGRGGDVRGKDSWLYVRT